MRAIILLACLLSQTALAGEFLKKKIQYDFMGDHLGNRIHYRCESVKKLAENHLTALGASSIQLKCTGGLESYGRVPYWTPLSVVAVVDVPVPSENSKREEMVLKSENFLYEDCFFNVGFLEKVLPQFPGVKILKQKTSCAHNYSRWSYTLEIAK